MKKLLIFSFVSLLGLVGKAQGDWLWLQPHYLSSEKPGGLVYGTFDYKINSNQLSNSLVNEALFDGAITEGSVELFFAKSSTNDVRVGGFAHGNLWYVSDKEGWQPIVGLGLTEHGGGKLKHDLVGVFLKGNSQYEDQRIDLGPSSLEYFGYQHLSLGAQKTTERGTFGFIVNALRGSGYQSLDIEGSDLYTAPFGEYVEANINLKISAVDTAGKSWAGTGASLSSFYSWSSDDQRNQVYVSVSDLGMIAFRDLQTSSVDSSYRFNGVEVQNFLGINDSVFEQNSGDSLDALLGIKSGTENKTVLLPFRLQAQFMHQFGDKWRGRLGVIWYGKSNALPLVQAAMAWKPSATFSLEPQLAYGGWGGLDFSIAASVQLFGSLQVFSRLNLIETMIAPQESTGQGVFVAAALNF